MANIKFNGIEDILKDFSEMEIKGFLSMDSLKKACSKMEEGLRKDIPKKSGKAKNCLGTYAKIDKQYIKVMKVGLDDEKTDWKDWKGVYFNNYGFNLVAFGKPTDVYVDKHLGWFDKSVAKNKSKVETALINELEKNIEKLL